jgi:MinD-like ATPase involved in chromosome partitioning or flagellar assembly
MDHIRSAPELDPYMSTTPTGLHLLAAPQRPEAMEEMTPEMYGRLLSFLGRFYHVILLDPGTGLTEPLARFALERSDQAVVVNTSDWITSSTVLDALDYVLLRLGGHQLTMVINKTLPLEPNAKHREGILAAIRLGLSNARLGGLNSKIRLISHRSFGFHSAAPLIALIYLCCGGIELELQSGD